ncbi:MAG: hypothetical protein UT20_C0032G0008 [Candidatus Levybacteria bacterium GW2011_GWA1_39_11]|nr:MAG: hypothetical protein UT20_C0032G0008 [Candidatus Levybacteria bacterium GW2011_GWA1_39_11]OGD88528.1 MAG: hypothetical protein A2Z54_00290 [Candidatus Curtissbacteria bacterium RIFCSPHIGHO2_02_39_8]
MPVFKLFDQKGFTFPELVIVMGVVAMLFGLVTFNLLKTQNKADVSSGVQTLVSDMKTQQGKAMMGVANQNNPSSYGIYFENNKYTLFRGTTYVAGDPSNFVVILSENMEFSSIAFPNTTLAYLAGSGEVRDFTSGSDSLTLRNKSSGDQKTVTVNKYGVITAVN